VLLIALLSLLLGAFTAGTKDTVIEAVPVVEAEPVPEIVLKTEKVEEEQPIE